MPGSPSIDHPKIAIIILNWNGWKDTIQCLESIYKGVYSNFDVIVVDNSSEDESVSMIKEWAKNELIFSSDSLAQSERIQLIELGCLSDSRTALIKMKLQSNSRTMYLIENKKNYGFAQGSNIAIKYALNVLKVEFALILNNDVVVEKTFLFELIKTMKTDENIGIVGAINYNYSSNSIMAIGEKINWRTGKTEILKNAEYLKSTEYLQFDEVPGSCLLVRSKLIRDIGLLDVNYFCYYEETDWCVRAKRKGWIVCACARSKIWHKDGQSVKKINGFKIFFLTRNRFLFMKKFSSKLGYILFIILSVQDLILTTGSLLFIRRSTNLLKIYFNAIHDGLVMKVNRP